MKKLYTILAVVLLTATTFAQAPEKMSYQAVVRCSDDVLVSNLPVGMQISILQTTATGTAVYVETQRPTTNVNGLVSLEIGTGTTTDDFSTIDWSTGPYFIKIETDPEGGSDYTITGASQLLSVPYALNAKWAESGNFIDLTTDQNIAGAKTFTQDATINFMNIGRGPGTEPFYSTVLGEEALKLNTTGAANTAVGQGALKSNTTGSVNVAVGEALRKNISGNNNTAMGSAVLENNTSGSYNTGVGSSNLNANVSGSFNTAIGFEAEVASGDLNNATAIGAGTVVGTSNSLVLGNNANVGIGTSAPLAKLDVVGNVKITDGTEGAGKILTSDATGLATWQDLAITETQTLAGVVALGNTADAQIKNVTDPTDAQDAATKAYVDVLQAQIAALDARITALEPQPVSIGDLRAGGVVFWVDSTGLHGLVCAFSDYVSTRQWGCFRTDLPNVPNVTSFPPSGLGAEIGDGINNTNNILNDCPSAPAALAARSFGPEWFLPSILELKEMYVNKVTLEAVAGFSAFSSYYWSSTDNDILEAWVVNFTIGGQNNNFKGSTGTSVRAVRAF